VEASHVPQRLPEAESDSRVGLHLGVQLKVVLVVKVSLIGLQLRRLHLDVGKLISYRLEGIEDRVVHRSLKHANA